MQVIASKPFKVKLKSKAGTVRTRWQVKLWSRHPYTHKLEILTQKTFESKAAASDSIQKLIKQYDQTHGRIREGERMTFSDLADRAKQTFYKPAVIIQGRKVDGVKQYKSIHSQIDVLTRYFGEMRLGQIGVNELKAYKKWRFDQGSFRGKTEGVPIGLIVINRELATMRRMMKQAFVEGWVTRDIFLGSKVIDAGAEKERSRIISANEEAALLSYCRGEHHPDRKTNSNTPKTINRKNEYLKVIIMLALDSAMRKTEILKLRWQDIDFENYAVRVIGEHTKTQTERFVPLSDRSAIELKTLPSFGKPGRVFPLSDFKRSWETTRRLAGIDDLHFHDLRRTAITRMQMSNIPLAVAGKIAGHAELKTTAKIYTAADASIVSQVRNAINRSNEERIQTISEVIN